MNDNLKPCPFCSAIPELPNGAGSQYDIECDCGHGSSGVQISDLMTIEERMPENLDPPDFRYSQKYIDRARDAAIEAWNTRASPWTLCSERMPDDHRPSYAVMDKEGSWHKVYIDGFWREDAIRGTVRFVPSHWIHSEGHRCELDEFTHWQLIEAPE